jgi:hypothetical protein
MRAMKDDQTMVVRKIQFRFKPELVAAFSTVQRAQMKD